MRCLRCLHYKFLIRHYITKKNGIDTFTEVFRSFGWKVLQASIPLKVWQKWYLIYNGFKAKFTLNEVLRT